MKKKKLNYKKQYGNIILTEQHLDDYKIKLGLLAKNNRISIGWERQDSEGRHFECFAKELAGREIRSEIFMCDFSIKQSVLLWNEIENNLMIIIGIRNREKAAEI